MPSNACPTEFRRQLSIFTRFFSRRPVAAVTHLADDEDRVVLAASVGLVEDLEVRDGDRGADGGLESVGGDHRMGGGRGGRWWGAI